MAALPPLLLLRRPEIESLETDPEVHLFTYQLNTPSFIIYLSAALILGGLATAMVLLEVLDNLGTQLVFCMTLVISLALSLWTLYGQHLSTQAKLAVSPTALYTGTDTTLWRIEWSLLSLEDFKSTEPSRFTGKITLNVAEQKIPLYLDSKFVALVDQPSFLASIAEMTKPHVPKPSLSDSTQANKRTYHDPS